MYQIKTLNFKKSYYVPKLGEFMKLQTTKYLYEYWNELRGKRIAPVRKELDPDVLKNILPNLFLWTVSIQMNIISG